MRVSGIPYIQGKNAYIDIDGKKYAIAIHNTSNNATDEAETSYATRRTDGVSSHFYCDNDSVIQSLDTASRAGHAGNTNGNNHAIAVEITGANGWTRQQWLDNVAWNKLGQVLAQVVKCYGIAVRRASISEMRNNPTVKAFYGHDDMRQAWGGTTHTDPGPNFPWDRLFLAVNTALGDDDVSAEDVYNYQLRGGDTNNTMAAKDFFPNIRKILLEDLHVGNQNRDAVNALRDELAALRVALLTAITALAGRDTVDEAALAREMGPAIAAALLPLLPKGVEVTEEALAGAFRSLLVGS